MATTTIAVRLPKAKMPLSVKVAGVAAAIAFVLLVLATTIWEPPLPAIIGGVFFVLLALFVVLVFPRAPYLSFILPGAAFYTIFVIVPSLQAFRLSVFDWSGYTANPREFIGFVNYVDILSGVEFWNALFNGVKLFILMFILQNIVSMALAQFLDSRVRFYEVYRAIFFMPVIISGMATGFIWQIMFGSNIGLLNPTLMSLGLTNWQQDWQGEMPWVWWVVVLVQFWAWNGMPVVIYLAGLQSVPNELKEAARIDGAGPFQVFRNVTFPLLAPAITVVTGLGFIGFMKALEIPMIMGGMRGGPGGGSDFLNLIIIRRAFGSGYITWDLTRNADYAVAVGVAMFLFILIVSVVLLPMLRRREVSL